MYLEMKDLSKSFDGKEVVCGLNLLVDFILFLLLVLLLLLEPQISFSTLLSFFGNLLSEISTILTFFCLIRFMSSNLPHFTVKCRCRSMAVYAFLQGVNFALEISYFSVLCCLFLFKISNFLIKAKS